MKIKSEQLKGKIDFGVISIREDEFEAVLRRFPQTATIEGRRRYALSKLPTLDNSEYTLALVRCSEQGTGEGQNVARDLIEDLDPHWILLVGIAGGIPADEYTLGDVIAATRLHDFTISAHIDGGFEEFAVTGGPMHVAIQDLLAFLPAMSSDLDNWSSETSIGFAMPSAEIRRNSIYGDKQWRKKVRASLSRHFSGPDQKRLPIVTTGAIGSSDRLVKDTETLKQWRLAARQLLAVEMELAGVYRAARRSDKEYPILAIRGVSDIVGYRRHPDWTEYACNSAAAFAAAILKTKPIPPRSNYAVDQLFTKGAHETSKSNQALGDGAVENIFRRRGSLALNDPSYITRDCDTLLKERLGTNSLIAITGDYQTGKSSLLNQTEVYVPRDWRVCYLDLAGTRTDDLNLLTTSFFRSISETIGRVESWADLSKHSLNESVLLLFDEFGSLSVDHGIAQGFIPKLIDLTNSPNIRIVVCVPHAIDRFIKDQNILNPKYWNSWGTVSAHLFNKDETSRLVNLLPPQLSRAIMSHLDNIHLKSKGHPRSLQCLCSCLFDSYRDGASGKDLIGLIYQDSSYQ